MKLGRQSKQREEETKHTLKENKAKQSKRERKKLKHQNKKPNTIQVYIERDEEQMKNAQQSE